MKVIKVSRKDYEPKEVKRFIGFYISEEDHIRTMLMSLLSKKGKSVVVRGVLLDWLKKQPDNQELIASISDQLYHLWESEHKIIGSEQVTLQKFIKEVRTDLESLVLPKEVVDKILENFDAHSKKYK